MKHPQTHLKQSSLLLCNNTTRLLFVALSLAISPIAGANADNTETAYVDSVHQWGAWELDIAPAAGGLQQATTQALNARDSRVTLRTNSIAALAPLTPAQPPAIIPSPIAPPVIPATPAPPVTPPFGGPASGIF